MKLLGESKIEDVLHRLDRLTLDEACMTGTETLQVIHGLVDNMKCLLNSTQLSLCRFLIAHRAVRIDDTASMDYIRKTLGMFSIGQFQWD